MGSYIKPTNWESKAYIPVMYELLEEMSEELAAYNHHSLTKEERCQLFQYRELCNEWQQQKLNPRQQAWVDLMQEQLSKLLAENDAISYTTCGYKW